ncbi:MAG: diacylglycerol kinase family lipid kinase [Candidatus Marinimicrobia bacterium]|jgi:YegS/Rv2252/BmrU family lipid kinase|nr:diacylglycerol kinase family lipid kinase [Candidatus Neomarinimicrobiota bacterium]HJM47900.1 diacylglycerol kinase family protein [Candidatus Neomarinimicrobiota bacterium]|tara:strand:- start:363 stop:1247 length:885 start_codon:yes stop_codon:yes gene_type:complete
MKYSLIVNPHGGVKSGFKILEKVKPYFDEANAELNIIETEYAGHARDIAAELPLDSITGFCAIGGDGTMHEIVNGMMSRKDGMRVPIGLITGGTGNSFMHDLDCLDPVEAVQRILTNRTRKIDLFKAEAKGNLYFGFNIVGWGMPTDINILAEKMRWLGGQRYNIASILEVLKFKTRLARIEIDGSNIVADFGFVIGCNTMYTGKGMKMAPLARLDDGLLDLIIVRKAGRIKLLRMFPKIFSGKHIADPIVEYRQVKTFSIYPEKQSTLNIDGEMLGNTPVKVEILTKAIEVLV